MAESSKSTAVKSVFKSGKSTTTEQEFTNKLIKMINILEGKKEEYKN